MTQLSAASGAVSQRKDAVDGGADQPDAGRYAQVSTQLSLAETQQTALEDVIAQLGKRFDEPVFSKL